MCAKRRSHIHIHIWESVCIHTHTYHAHAHAHAHSHTHPMHIYTYTYERVCESVWVHTRSYPNIPILTLKDKNYIKFLFIFLEAWWMNEVEKLQKKKYSEPRPYLWMNRHLKKKVFRAKTLYMSESTNSNISYYNMEFSMLQNKRSSILWEESYF